MSFVDGLLNVVKGAAAGAAVVVALPVFGVVGAATTTGLAVGSVIGAGLGVVDSINDEEK